MHVCAQVQVYVGIHVHDVCMYMHTPAVNNQCLPLSLATIFLRQAFSPTLELTNCLDSLASRLHLLDPPSESFGFHLPSLVGVP